MLFIKKRKWSHIIVQTGANHKSTLLETVLSEFMISYL